jgi:ferrochelatase
MAADAVLLIAFGGPTRPEEIRPFLENVTRGRRIPPERLEEVVHHYELIGGRSPLNELTLRQAAGLRTALAAAGRPLPVWVGMRNWAPYIADVLAEMADAGVRRAVGLILSAHATDASTSRYVESVDEGRARLGERAPEIVWAPGWHLHPGFVAAAADGVRTALAAVAPDGREVVFTAHSVPVAMAEGSPYVAQVRESAAAVAALTGIARWDLAWQSRSGGPRDPWLEPDVNDVIRRLAAAGARGVVTVPIGFVSDHVEVLYDLDVEARATATGLGLAFARASTANDHPAFVHALAEVVREVAS